MHELAVQLLEAVSHAEMKLQQAGEQLQRSSQHFELMMQRPLAGHHVEVVGRRAGSSVGMPSTISIAIAKRHSALICASEWQGIGMTSSSNVLNFEDSLTCSWSALQACPAASLLQIWDV